MIPQEQPQAQPVLADADHRLDEFLATLAHELRNPLAPLRNGLKIIKLAGADATAVAEAREMMERQLEHMVRLVDELLDLCRMRHGTLRLKKAPTDIALIVRRALETSSGVIQAAGQTLHVSLPGEPVPIEADATRLTQVLINLLDNATKYNRRGGRIWLNVEFSSGGLRISVRDEGTGIASSMLTRVFETFANVTPSLERSHGGLGIGLAIVRQLVELHGGTVEAHSEGLGAGSEFVVHLPIGECTVPKRLGGIDAGTGAAPRRILVVDDNIDSALSLARILEIEGHDVCTAHDGPAALDAAASFLPEVIFLDIGLPKLNGYEVCRRIRAQAWADNVTVVALTGWGQEQDLHRSQAAGFNRHLVKPVDIAVIEELLAALPPATRATLTPPPLAFRQ